MRFTRLPRVSLHLATLLGLLALPFSAPAQEQDTAPKVKIDWQDGPTIGKLGDLAEIKIPEGYRFAGADGTRKFLELTQNPPAEANSVFSFQREKKERLPTNSGL